MDWRNYWFCCAFLKSIGWLTDCSTRKNAKALQGKSPPKGIMFHVIQTKGSAGLPACLIGRCCSCFWFRLVLVPLFSCYTFLLHLNRVHPPPPISTLTNLLVIGCFHTGTQICLHYIHIAACKILKKLKDNPKTSSPCNQRIVFFNRHSSFKRSLTGEIFEAQSHPFST